MPSACLCSSKAVPVEHWDLFHSVTIAPSLLFVRSIVHSLATHLFYFSIYFLVQDTFTSHHFWQVLFSPSPWRGFSFIDHNAPLRESTTTSTGPWLWIVMRPQGYRPMRKWLYTFLGSKFLGPRVRDALLCLRRLLKHGEILGFNESRDT